VKNFSWISFSVALLIAAIAGIVASNLNFFPTEDDKTLRSYLIKAAEDPQFSASMSKTFQTKYEEKGIYPTKEQIRLTNECIKTEIDNQLINSKDTSIKTHLDEEYEIKSTADWKKLFNSEIMDKYRDTLSNIVRNCQAINVENKLLSTTQTLSSSDEKGFICKSINIYGEFIDLDFDEDKFFLINLDRKTVARASLPSVDFSYHDLRVETVDVLGWRNGDTSIEHVNRENLLLSTYFCHEEENWLNGICFPIKAADFTRKKCEVLSGEELKFKWKDVVKKASEKNKI